MKNISSSTDHMGESELNDRKVEIIVNIDDHLNEADASKLLKEIMNS